MMKITKRQLRRIIHEEKQKLLKESFAGIGRGAPSPMKSRVDAEFAAAIKGNRLQEVEFHGSPVSTAIKDLIAALSQLDRLDRSMTIYDLIDQLEQYAQTDEPPIF